MFVKRRKQLGSSLNSSQVTEAGTPSPVSNNNVPVANGSAGRKNGSLSSTPLNGSVPSLKGVVAVKREEKDGGAVGRKSVGGVVSTSANIRSPASTTAITLESVLPGMQSVLFSADANNLLKARELKKLSFCMKEWGSVNVSFVKEIVDFLPREGLLRL